MIHWCRVWCNHYIISFEDASYDAVAFKMISENTSKVWFYLIILDWLDFKPAKQVMAELDTIRKEQKKFICLNDNINHEKEGADLVRDRESEIDILLMLFLYYYITGKANSPGLLWILVPHSIAVWTTSRIQKPIPTRWWPQQMVRLVYICTNGNILTTAVKLSALATFPLVFVFIHGMQDTVQKQSAAASSCSLWHLGGALCCIAILWKSMSSLDQL